VRNGARITTHADVTSPRGGFVLLATARTAQQAQFIFGARQPGSRTFPLMGALAEGTWRANPGLALLGLPPCQIQFRPARGTNISAPSAQVPAIAGLGRRLIRNTRLS
jgi:hypothetical protein